MGVINILSDDLINKIAAGEVIERPSSIVKELVENSIDAGATEITVEIENGGISFIKVIDNGKGIDKEDIDKAFLRHATSKIREEKDLFKITSLGFRGEALASIAAIAKIEMITKTRNSEFGYKVIVENCDIISKEECGSNEGTSITVKDIFYNVPARLKFLKTPTREQMYITDLMENLALSHPQISFRYIINKKLIFKTNGDGNLKNVIYTIYGKNIYENLIEVNCSKESVTLKGFIGNSKIEKNNRNYQSLFVNGRYVKNKTITTAIESAYKSMISINKFPLYIMHVFINPESIDINVHPTKAEIKFEDEQKIFKEVYACIKNALINTEYLPTYKVNFQKNIYKTQISSNETNMEPIDIDNLKNTLDNNQQLSFKYNESIFEDNFDNNYNVFLNEDTDSKIKEDIDFDNKNKVNTNETINIFTNEFKNINFPQISIVGQIHFMYIIAESTDGFYLIDQHAAHERILYEKYLRDFNNIGISKQYLISPIIIELSNTEKQFIMNRIEFLDKLGFEIEDFGGNSISLRTIPNNLIDRNYKDVLEDIIQSVDNNDMIKTIDKVIYTLACKSAIKAGDKLNYKEMYNLIEELKKCFNPFTCPHGRPIMIKFEYLDLEKNLKEYCR